MLPIFTAPLCEGDGTTTWQGGCVRIDVACCNHDALLEG
jgi:hypothetical protein